MPWLEIPNSSLSTRSGALDLTIHRFKLLNVSRGEKWECYLGYNIGGEQNGHGNKFTRPVLIVQMDKENKNKISPNTIIVPLSKLENRGEVIDLEKVEASLRSTEFLLKIDDVSEGEVKLLHPSIGLCQNVKEISKERLDYKITRINDDCWDKINTALKFSLGIE